MKDLKYFNTFLDYYNKLINKFKSNNNNIEACTIIDENYTNIITPKGVTNIPGKGANDTFDTPGKRADFTAIECTMGKRANSTAIECTMGKGANSTAMECTSEKNINEIAAVTNFGESSTFSKDTNDDTVEISKTPSGDKESHFGFGEESDVELDTVTEEFLELKIRNKEIKKLNEILENYHKKDEKLIKKLKKLKCSNKEYDYFPKLGDEDHDLWDLKTITYDIDINYIHILFFNHYNLNENYKISDRVDGIENGIGDGIGGVNGIGNGIGNGIDGIENSIDGIENGIDGIGRYNIMKIEKMIMKSIENINEMEEILIDKFGIEITKTNINCLFNNNWINDEIINFYLQLLQNHNHVILDCYNYNTFFYERLSVGEMSYDYMSVKRWTRRKKINIFEKDLLFIPINVSKIHWALGVVDMRKKWRRIMLFDSLGGSNPHFFKTIKKYLQDEYKEIFNNTININEWKIRNGYYSEPYAPIQQNTYDCGLFLCQYAKCITFGNKFNFINFNSKFLRNLMIYEILTNNIILI